MLPKAWEHGMHVGHRAAEPGLFVQSARNTWTSNANSSAASHWSAVWTRFLGAPVLRRRRSGRGHPGDAGRDRHVHLEDIGVNRVHQHVLPGKGMDFPGIFAA